MNGRSPPDPFIPTGGRSNVLPILLTLLFAGALVALGIVFFTGVVRFGTPRIGDLATCSKVDGEAKPVKKTDSFSGDESRIYCCCDVNAFEDTMLKARWRVGGELVESFEGSFGEMAGSATGKFMTTGANLAFYLDEPEKGWIPGRYTVELLLDGEPKASTRFTVDLDPADDDGMVKYKDPDGRFTVRYPEEWVPADISTVDGALVGFIGPGVDGYEPRFVVLQTGLESAAPDYLNEALGQPGDQREALFSSYNVGEAPGAMRAFTWPLPEEQAADVIQTVQVLAEGAGGVYEINCHCLADQLEVYGDTFNRIINSFRFTEEDTGTP